MSRLSWKARPRPAAAGLRYGSRLSKTRPSVKSEDRPHFPFEFSTQSSSEADCSQGTRKALLALGSFTTVPGGAPLTSMRNFSSNGL
jgi:hypothetical protein